MPPRDERDGGDDVKPRRKRTKRSAADAALDDSAADVAAGAAGASSAEDLVPAPTIVFSTGRPCAPPSNWALREAAVQAAKFEPSADSARLAGSVTFTFCVSAAVKDKPDAFLRALRAPVHFEPVTIRRGCVRTWDADGEPANEGGIATVGRVLAAVREGKLRPASADALPFLTALEALVYPDGPWQSPVARALAHCPPRLQPGAGPTLTLTFHVYFLRLAFELIACEHIAVVMSHLTPAGAVQPVRPLPQHPRSLFLPPGAAEADAAEDPFTLPALLKGMEHQGYRTDEPQPAGIALPMFPYQLQALAWMRDQEARPGGLNAAFWETRRWGDAAATSAAEQADEFFYFPLAGELRLQRPPLVTGGMLCEQMGLGKTLEMCALIVADKAAAQAAVRDAKRAAAAAAPPPSAAPPGAPAAVPSRATLVVVPTSLLGQWRREIQRSAPGVLSVAMHPPDLAVPDEEEEEEEEEEDDDGDASMSVAQRAAARTAAASARVAAQRAAAATAAAQFSAAGVAALADHDVVLTTYRQLDAEASGRGRVLSRIHWRRIVLDECQEVRSNTTALSRAAASLRAQHRWMVSGTPLFSSVDDLNGELMFLGVWPFSLSNKQDGFWARKVTQPWLSKEASALALLRALLSGIAIRHSKRQCDAAGVPLAQLPPASAQLRPVTLSGSDRYVVTYLEALAAQVAAVSLDAGLPPAVDGSGAVWASGSAASRRRAARTADGLLRLLRESCSAPAMPRVPAPPAGAPAAAVAAAARADSHSVRAYLREVDRLIRAIGGGDVAGAAGGGADDAACGGVLELPAMSAEAALRVLMRRRALQGSAADTKAGLVRTDAARGTGAYDANRERAMLTVQDRLADASAELAAIASELSRAREWRASVPRLRWQGAAAAVCAGRLLAWHAPLRLLRRSFARAALALALRAAEAADARAREEADAFLERQSFGTRRVDAARAAHITVEELREELLDVATAAGLKPQWLSKAPHAEAVAALSKAERAARTAAAKALAEKAPAGWYPARGAGAGHACAASERLFTEATERVARLARAEEASAAQQALMARLRAAAQMATTGGTAAADVDYRVVAQRGFQDVLQIAEGGAPPDCCICFQPAAAAVVTPCVHITCRECMLAWLRTKAAAPGAQRNAPIPCPFCRRGFRRAEVIQVLPPAPAAAADGAGGSTAADGAGPSRAQAADAGVEVPPSFSLAATDADVDVAATAAAEAAADLLPRSGQHPAVPRLFLTHLHAARAALGAKLSALMADIDATLASDPAAKAVVFSQLPSAVAHVATLLQERGIGAVRILPGMPEPERRAAVERFNGDAAVRVFVLHVGAAAAGLTLTAASTMMLLEPFLCAGDEAQARNRCHRIGQTRPVRTLTYFARGTVEERLLAYRAFESTGAAGVTAAGVTAGAAEAPELAVPEDAAAAAAAAARRRGKRPAREVSDDEDSDDDARGKRARRGAAGRAAAAAFGEEGDALATLAADATRTGADDTKLRFLFGLPPRTGGSAAAR